MLTVEKLEDCPRCGRPLKSGYDLQRCGRPLPRGNRCWWGGRHPRYGVPMRKSAAKTKAGRENIKKATAARQKLVTLDDHTITQKAACLALGIDAASLRWRMQRYGISRQEAVDYYAARRVHS